MPEANDNNFESQLAAFMGGGADDETAKPNDDAGKQDEGEQQQAAATEPAKPAEPTQADKAKALGWNPDKDKFEADTGKEWSTAGQFLRNREMADEIHKRGQEAKQLRKKLEAHEKQTQSISERVDKITQGEHNAKVDQLTQSIRQAAVDQDFDAMDALIAERDKLLKIEPVPKQQEPRIEPDGGDWPYTESAEDSEPIIEKWKSDNKWFDKSGQAIRDEAKKFEAEYLGYFPNCPVGDALAYVAQKMLEKHPVLAAHGVKLKIPDATPRNTERLASKTFAVSQLDKPSQGIYNAMKKSGQFKTPADEQAFLKDALGA